MPLTKGHSYFNVSQKTIRQAVGIFYVTSFISVPGSSQHQLCNKSQCVNQTSYVRKQPWARLCRLPALQTHAQRLSKTLLQKCGERKAVVISSDFFRDVHASGRRANWCLHRQPVSVEEISWERKQKTEKGDESRTGQEGEQTITRSRSLLMDKAPCQPSE